MRKFLFPALLTALLPVSAAFAQDDDVAAAFAEDRPNIIFFLTDDQRDDFLGCTGHPIVKTPVIDGLAKEGVLYENAFVSTSICAASRATLLTGLYERTHGYTFGKPKVASIHIAESYPAMLRKDGYRTGFIGKFGVGVHKGAKEVMFDTFVPLNRNPYHHKMPDGSTRHETEVAGDKAIEFLRAMKGGGHPFCLSVSFNASHAEDGDKKDHFPYPKAVAHLYKDMEMPAPRHADPKVFESQPEFMRKSMNRDRYFWRWDTPEKYQHNMRNYLRMISGIDGSIGRVLKEVKTLGMADNTVVIYMADNGYYAASRGFAGKWSHYEESQRVPLIIFDPRAPKEKRGVKRKGIALNVDIAPTILTLGNVSVPKGHQGRDLVAGKAPDAFFCEHRMENKSIPKWQGVREGRYKYARYYGQDPPFEFLHDLQADPNEFKNLADDPGSKAELERLRKRCDQLDAEYLNQAKADAQRTLKKAQFGMLNGAHGDQSAALEEALALDPASEQLLLARAEAHEKAGRFGKALADYDKLLANNPDNLGILNHRGEVHFFHGDMAGAIADFDAFLKRVPAREPHHWQRGLAYYYAGKFKEGVEQFEIHREVNANDVENAVWQFICRAQLEGFDAAREKLMPIKGDARVPMKEIHQLFAGTLEPKDVIAACHEGDPSADDLRNHLCYAHQYLSLYWEAKGDAAKSLMHMKKSAVEHSMPHYMGEVSRVHLRMRRK